MIAAISENIYENAPATASTPAGARNGFTPP